MSIFLLMLFLFGCTEGQEVNKIKNETNQTEKTQVNNNLSDEAILKKNVKNSNNSEVLPKNLLEICRDHGWDQVANYYKDRPYIQPPYIKYADSNKNEVAVFWCEGSGYNEWYLLFHTGSAGEVIDGCPKIVPWNNYPAGLTFVDNYNFNSRDGFYYIEDPTRDIKEVTTKEFGAIVNEYDGLEEVFYCLNGKWVVKMGH